VRASVGTVGAESLRALPSVLISETVDRLGPGLALREYEDPARAAFVLPPSDTAAVILVTRGRYVLETGPRRARAHALMSPGSTSVTRPGREIHAGWRTSGSSPMASLHLHAATAVLERTADDIGHGGGPAPDYLHRDDAFLAAALAQLAVAVRAAAPRLHLDTLAQGILQHLLLHDPRPASAAPPMSARTLAAVVELMHARMADPLQLEDLAAVAHLSPHHFLRRFRAATGSPPMRLLTRIRMEHARELLADDGLTIQQVAARCGYTSASAFSAVFRRTTGRSPSEFRIRAIPR